MLYASLYKLPVCCTLCMDRVWSKNVPRPNWSDVALAFSSNRNCTNTITTVY